MGFFLVLIGMAVVWLLFKQGGRSQDRRQIRELLDLVGRLEQRIAALERPTQTKPQPAPPERVFTGPPVYPAQPVAQAAAPPPPPPQREAGPVPVPVVAFAALPPSVVARPETGPRIEDKQPALPQRSPSLEERLGANWLNKLGIVILVVGVSLFLAYQLRAMGPAGKAAVGCILGLGLLVGGLFLERRSRYRIFARAGIGGGWALTFFVAYAMYHLDAMRVVESQLLDLVLMMLVATGMVWHSLRYKSQVVTGLAFLLAFGTVGISHVTLFSLVAGALLAAGLVYVAAREYWYELGLAGLAGVYLNHLLWLRRVLPEGGVPGHPFPEFLPSAGLLLLYWLIFRLAYVLRTPHDHRQESIAAATAILNSAGLMGLLKYQSSHPEWAFWALLTLGGVEMGFALFAWRKRRSAFIVLSSLASVLLLSAIPFRFSGSNWSLLWLLEAEALFLAGLRLREPVFRRLGLFAGFAAALQLLLVLVDASPIFDLRQGHDDLGRHPAIALALLSGAALFWINAHLAPLRWKELLEREIDAVCLTATSYVGLTTAIAGLWIFFPGTQTIVAWMLVAVLLGLAADRLESTDLAMQGDLLAAGSLLRAAAINLQSDGLQSEARWGFVSLRAATVGSAAALLYLGARRRTEARLLPPGYVAAAYTWAGSALLGVLLWYELRPIAVAVGWGVLGLILFELGFVLRRSYLRQQGYVLLAASFVRIFFANFNLGGDSFLSSPRVYTVLPLAAAYLWVYERLQSREASSREDRAMQSAAAWAASIAVAALAYFEVAPEWVAVAWAALVFVLILAGWALGRTIFAAQALTLLLATGGRALLFNLLSSPPLNPGFWNTRTESILATCVLLLCALPLAFRVRSASAEILPPAPHRPWWTAAVRHPEQGLFFVPLILATVFLAIQMRAGMITVSWSALGVAVFLFALLVGERSFRLAGLGLLLLGVGKILLVDIWKAAPADRYITLIVMGASLLLISFLYTRYHENILKFL